jgi:hypothetical protein
MPEPGAGSSPSSTDGRVSYLAFKFIHVLLAIFALGTSASLGVVLSFFAGDPAHRDFALRLVRRLLWIIVIPGYLLLLATGLWMGHLAALLDARWTEAAMDLWGIGASFLGLTLWSVGRQIRGTGTATASRLFGAGWGLVALVILYFMVFKPA